jgi:hypothetical protein
MKRAWSNGGKIAGMGKTKQIKPCARANLSATHQTWAILFLMPVRYNVFSKLHGVEMAWPGYSLGQTWLARKLYGVDMARQPAWSRYGSTTFSMEQIWHGQYAP